MQMNDNQTAQLLDKEHAKIVLEQRAMLARHEVLIEHFPEDVRTLYAIWQAETGPSQVARDILRVLHTKNGTIEPIELRRFDLENRRVVMRLLEICMSPSILSDRGLEWDTTRTPLLSKQQVESLFAPDEE